MIRVEFQVAGKVYQCAVGDGPPPPETLKLVFKPCTLKPPVELQLRFLGTDELRGVELYRPAEMEVA